MPRNRNHKKGTQGSDDEDFDQGDRFDQFDSVPQGAKGGGKKVATTPARKQSTPPPPPAPTQPKKHKDPKEETPEDGKFTHGINVYNRIFHDVLPACDWELGYEDRFKGLMWMPVENFRHTGDETREIPFHRVYKYKYKGQLVWDRVKKLDCLDDVYGRAYKAIGKSGPVSSGVLPLASTMPSLKNVPHQKKLTVVTPTVDGDVEVKDAEVVKDAEKVKLATFNVLFDLFDADKIHTEKRLPLICKALEDLDADLIALQELTPKIYKNIRTHSAKLCGRYYWTSLPTDVGTCQAVLSKEPIVEAVSCQMSKNKRCIFVSTSVKCSPVAVAAVHLISDHGGEVAERRKGELVTITTALQEHPAAIMLGDFNFGDLNNPHENGFIKNCTFSDCFLAVGGGVPKAYDGAPLNDQAISKTGGYFTFDMLKNPVARATCKETSVPRRLDRILVRGFTPVDYCLFANSSVEIPVGNGTLSLFPSDHFGVSAGVTVLGAGGAQLPSDDAVPTTGPEGETAAAMSTRLAPNFFGHHGSALCIILPDHLHDAVNGIRKHHDKAYPRWMPHINLLFPFVCPSQFPDAVELISRALAEVQPKPFQVALKKVGHFNAKKPVMFLAPETDSTRPLHQLQAMLQGLFPQCRRNVGTAGNDDDDGGFQPHATLGQVEHGQKTAFEASVHAQWTPTEFVVDSLYLIAKLEGSEKYEIMNKFEFPKTETEGNVAVAGGDTEAGGPKKKNPEDLMVLEDPKYGNRKLSPYLPQDPLELWMLQVSQPLLARTQPTHISQRGAMYHVPQHLLDTYLQRWADSVSLCREVKFYMEEVRTAGAFRLYLDLDIKRCSTNEPYEATALMRLILEFTEVVLAYFARLQKEGAKLAQFSLDSLLDKLFFAPDAAKGLRQNAKSKARAALVDTTCLVTECHTEASDGKDESVTFKSGFRMYFQRIFVTEDSYKVFVRLLCSFLKRQTAVPVPTHLPAAYQGWDEVTDVQGASWERARMFGSVKRRNQHKDVRRIHSLHRVLVSPGLVLATNGEAKELTQDELAVSVKAEEDQATAFYSQPEHLPATLYAQEVRVWNSQPVDSRIQYCNNQFLAHRLIGVFVVEQ